MSRRDDEPLCSCCETHPDERAGGRMVKCVECGEPCTCEGCIADVEDKLDEERRAAMEGGE